MDGIAWAASAMEAAQRRLEIATENLANVSSDGYRRREARGFLTATGVRIASYADTAHGALRRTGRPYDLAIVGNGAFRVRDARGEVTTTRAGAFERDRDGHLRDAQGRLLLGASGSPVRVRDGETVTARQLGLPRDAALQSGALECSSVDAIGEMLDVLQAQRAYEGAEKVVSAIDETSRRSSDSASVK